MWTAKLLCNVPLTFEGMTFTDGENYIHYESIIYVPSQYKITGVYITSTKKIEYSLPEKEILTDTSCHVKINTSVPDGATVTLRINTEKVIKDTGYTIQTNLPSFVALSPQAGKYTGEYAGELVCTDNNYSIKSASITRNGNSYSGVTVEDGKYKISIKTFADEDIFLITATAEKSRKTFTFTVSCANCTIEPPESDNLDEYHGIFAAKDGYEISAFSLEKNYNPIETNYTKNDDDTYSIDIEKDDFVDGDIFRISATTKQKIDYTVETNFNIPVIFNPAIENPLHSRYAGYMSTPENYHFVHVSCTLNGESSDKYLQKQNDKKYIFSTTVNVKHGDKFVISGRIEKDVDENNKDKYPFIHLYNPTNKNLDDLAKQGCPPYTSYEEGSNELSRYIVRLCKVFCNIPSSKKEGIMLASYDSMIQANVIDTPDIELFCGEIKIEEHFQNIADYDLTYIQFYIPFVGLVDVESDLVMNQVAGLKYNISLATGDFIATIYIVEESGHREIKLLSGNMFIEIPFTTDYRKNIEKALTDKGFSLIDLTPYISVRYHNPIGLDTKYSHETKQYVKLDELEGFTIVFNIELNLTGYEKMLYDEEMEILELLKEGVIL